MITLMMEAVHTSETSINFNMTTQRYIPEDSELHTHCHDNLKCYKNGEDFVITRLPSIHPMALQPKLGLGLLY
jgi:hypothetical protein